MNQLHANQFVVPADGIKGKTWGPSTLHQRERGHLPALRPTARTPHFSKSAPNLDKSQTAGGAGSTSLGGGGSVTSSSRHDILGKSDEVLNKSHTTATSARRNFPKYGKNDSYEHHNNDEDEEDDDIEMTKGCFGFIRAEDSSNYSKHKKYSLDSTLDHMYGVELRSTENGNGSAGSQMSSQPTYDRVFYREIQKSLDNIFGREELTLQTQNARNSKSSGDLTAFSEKDEDTYGQYLFQHFDAKSKFERECFFTANNRTSGVDLATASPIVDESPSTSSENDASFASNGSYFKDRRKDLSFGAMDDSFRSMNLSESSHRSTPRYEERKNSMCSDHSVDSSTMSRKSSVTFRSNVDSMNDSSFAYRNDRLIEDERVTGNDISATFLPSRLNAHGYGMIVSPNLTATTSPNNISTSKPTKSLKSALRNNNNNINSATATSNSSKKSRLLSLGRLFKLGSKSKPIVHSNSFYGKFDKKNELSEQLLPSDESVSSGSAILTPIAGQTYAVGSNAMSATNEPQYDAIFRTRNFLLAKQND